MIANPDKFHSIISFKNKVENLDLEVRIGDQTIKSEKYVKFLGVISDNKFHFENM